MTDSALIHTSQTDPDLNQIRVLIIDEAHERSLNTDIVVGIAKLLLAKRPNNFYVVIASATILILSNFYSISIRNLIKLCQYLVEFFQ